MPLTTLLDIVKSNGNDAVVGLIDETTKVHPEISLMPARTIKGVGYHTYVRTALGRTTGSFRTANAGTTAIRNKYERRYFETYILEPRFEVDKAVADRHEDGAAAFIASETEGIMEGEWQGLCSQFYYGSTTANGAIAFPGLIDAYDAQNMVIDAGGTTANTGSSVWFVRTLGPKDVTWVWGQNGTLTMSPVTEVTLLDPTDPTKKFQGYASNMIAYPGLQVGSTRILGRIKNLTEDAGKGLNDTLINKMLGKFPAGLGPTHIFMNQRSGVQLQNSRTATSPTGKPADYVSAIVGLNNGPNSNALIPVYTTDAISITESLTL